MQDRKRQDKQIYHTHQPKLILVFGVRRLAAALLGIGLTMPLL